jgi:hypothetical protein
MQLEDLAFFKSIEAYVQKHPERSTMVMQAVQAGISGRLESELRRATDMETVAAFALNTRMFNNKPWYVVELLKKWEGKTNINFTSMIQEIEKKFRKDNT